jgi:hypothetical protein
MDSGHPPPLAAAMTLPSVSSALCGLQDEQRMLEWTTDTSGQNVTHRT